VKHFAPFSIYEKKRTLMASLGVEAKVAQELMRHASFRTTMDSYTQALDEPKRQAQSAWPT
jgi:integrase